MINRIVAAVVMGTVFSAGSAQAGDGERSVPLEWRAGKAAGMRVAQAPHATIMLKPQPQASIVNLAVTFDDGTYCTTSALDAGAVSMSCGSKSGYYHLQQMPGYSLELAWVGAGAVGEK